MYHYGFHMLTVISKSLFKASVLQDFHNYWYKISTNHHLKYMLSVQFCQWWSHWVSCIDEPQHGVHVCSREPPDHHTAVYPIDIRQHNIRQPIIITHHNSSHCQHREEPGVCFLCYMDNWQNQFDHCVIPSCISVLYNGCTRTSTSMK